MNPELSSKFSELEDGVSELMGLEYDPHTSSELSDLEDGVSEIIGLEFDHETSRELLYLEDGESNELAFENIDEELNFRGTVFPNGVEELLGKVEPLIPVESEPT